MTTDRIEWTVEKPFIHDNKPAAKGATVQMTRKQAEFLVMGGFLSRRPATKPAAPKTAKKDNEQ